MRPKLKLVRPGSYRVMRCTTVSLAFLSFCSIAVRPGSGFQCVSETGWARQPVRGGHSMKNRQEKAGEGRCPLLLTRRALQRHPGPASYHQQSHPGRRMSSSNLLSMQLKGNDERLPSLLHDVPAFITSPDAGFPSVIAGAAIAGSPAGKTVGDPKKRQRFLSAVASIVIAAFTLTACGTQHAAYGEFDIADRARPTDEVVLDMKNMQEACSNGWAPNWRDTGKASICLEPDGCLWRKVDFSAKEPGRKWYAPVYEQAAQTYNVPFVNYLTRYIINYDPRWQEWWTLRQQAMGAKDAQQADLQLQGELNRFAGSVEFGLSKYQGAKGVERLFAELDINYGDAGAEARRQLALTFSLLDPAVQPTEQILSMAPAGTVRDASSVGKAQARKIRVLAADSLKKPMVAEVGVRPGMLPENVQILKSKGVFTIAGFERPVGNKAEDIFGERHPGGPVKRERMLEPAIYAASALSGLFCCSVMHLITVPVDVIKTRMQSPSFSGRYKGLRQGLQKLWSEEGVQGVTLGWQPTLLGFSFYGITVYPGYEMFKRSFVAIAGEANDALYHVPLVLAAGAASTAIACLGVCPAEVTRIRMVSNPSYAPSAMAVATRIVKEEGFFRGLYEGFSFVLARQVLFGMVKFLVFDTFATWVYSLIPVLAEGQLTQLGVSLLSGAVAGVIATIVSQPADAVLTRMKDAESVDAATVISEMWAKGGPTGFFAGLGSRCVWAGAIIAGQFLLYEVCKGVFQITADDLSLFLDVIGSIELGSGMAGLRN